jgi:parallel beta-helix repeat protein
MRFERGSLMAVIHRHRARHAVFVSVLLVLSTIGVPSATAAGTFWDDDGNPHEADIEAIAKVGITKGCAPGRYCPTAPVTRAEMAEFLARAFSLETSSSPDAFTDITSSPHRSAINAIAAAGISNGCGDGRFCPSSLVTRAEMASFLVRAAGLAPTATRTTFADDDGNPHEPDIEALAAAGITNGCAANAYCPFGAVHRDQMASFLARTLGLDPIVPTPVDGHTVDVAPGADLGALVSANPPGTVFVLGAGIHRIANVHPKDGQVFRGQAGVVATGDDQSKAAFAGSASDVVIEGIVFEHYASDATFGVIQPAESATGWTIQDSVFRYNASVGVVFQSGFTVRRNHIHHNGQLGVKGYGDGALLEDNEISHNNPDEKYDFGWEAGASKFIRTTNLTVRGNHVHHNRGPGLWTDGFNRNTLYEDNTVEYNAGPGIFHEISYEAVIRNNTVRGNAHDFYIGGILIANSSGVEVYGNTVTDNDGGIIGLEDDRSAYGVFLAVTGLWVHDNSIAYTGGVSGLWSNHGTGIYQRDNRFDRNTYTVTSATPFRWNNQYVSWDAWRAAGQDPNGSLG